MSRVTVSTGVEIEYDTFGDHDDPALLLVMGFTAQMTLWHEDFCRRLAAGGRHVIRFDNRDCGLSGKLDGVAADPMAVMAAAMAGSEIPAVPYTLSDMAADGLALLDELGVARAHVVGASMGGMIVQTMAIEHPERLLSVTSIMSTVGDLAYGKATPDALGVLLRPPPGSRDEVVARSTDTAVWSSKRYFDPERARELAGFHFDRSFYPEGATRQLAAIYASGDRSDGLRSVDVPFLVVHGRDDCLIDPSGGRRTAELVPGAHLLEVADMGHDLPEPLWPLLCGAILGHQDVAAAERSTTGATA
jgi:pimeloyl-ACP methyl ester carboxylesterase